MPDAGRVCRTGGAVVYRFHREPASCQALFGVGGRPGVKADKGTVGEARWCWPPVRLRRLPWRPLSRHPSSVSSSAAVVRGNYAAGWGTNPPDAGFQASKEVGVPSAPRHPIKAACRDQFIDEPDKDLDAAGGFAASSPR